LTLTSLGNRNNNNNCNYISCAHDTIDRLSCRIDDFHERNIQIKRKQSPQNAKTGNMAKVYRVASKQLKAENTSREKIFPSLENQVNVLVDTATESEKRKPMPHPICILITSNSLVDYILELIRNDNFHVIPLTKGNIHETKVQVKYEDYVRIQIYYTYQFKGSKGQQVIKGIEADVQPTEEYLPILSLRSSFELQKDLHWIVETFPRT